MTHDLPAQVTVPGTSLPLSVHGEYIAMKPIVEHFGLDWSAQLKKLKSRSWTRMAEITTQLSGESQVRFLIGVDRRTLTMWLATLPETRVRPELRPELIAYQREAAGALDVYFHEGVAINPRVDVSAIDLAIGKLALLKAAAETGLLDTNHLAARAEILVARELGERPAIPAAVRPVYVDEYMRSRNLSAKVVKKYRGQFGKDALAAYVAKHGSVPDKVDTILDSGKILKANAYVAMDTDVLEAAWDKMIERHPEILS